jgi:hypothetical protein
MKKFLDKTKPGLTEVGCGGRASISLPTYVGDNQIEVAIIFANVSKNIEV